MIALSGLVAALVLTTGGPAIAEPAAEAEKTVVQCEVLTVLELLPGRVQRLDAILYDVQNGSVDQFDLKLPPGLEIERGGTDEGEYGSMGASGGLTLPRKRPLQGAGHLLLVSPPTSLPADGISLEPVKPEAEVRASYLALSSLLPADVRLLPEASGTRVSTSDLPAAFSKAVAFIDRMVVWRLAADGEGARLAVAPLPLVPPRDAVIHRRDTTILMDMGGKLLFLDRFLFKWRIPAALDMVMPAGGKLLAAQVNGMPVREPQEEGGMVSVPLSWENPVVVEVVSVQEREGLRSGRSQLALDLPQVTTPVLVHRLRWVVPGNASYRVRRGDLRAILPWYSVFAKDFDFEVPRTYLFSGPVSFQKEIDQLMERLLGVETPFSASIPDDGKVLAFTGVLPPPRVTVELDVRAEK